MDFSKLDLSTELSREFFISKFREFCDYSNQLANQNEKKQDTLVELQQIQDNLSKYKRTMLSLHTELEQIKKENKELLLKIEQLQIIDKQNSGHGATLLKGYHYALENNAKYVFQTDSDGQTEPIEFYNFWEKRNQYDVIIGNRTKRQDGASRIFVTKEPFIKPPKI